MHPASTSKVGGGRRRLGTAAWQRLMDEFEAGGQTQSSFCSKHDLALSTFGYWRRKLSSSPASEAPAAEASPLFVELAESELPQPAPSAPAWDVELTLGGGVVLRLRQG